MTVNGRFQFQQMTGVHRYASEICRRLTTSHRVVHPGNPLSGVIGHLWEQIILPKRLGKDLLWSPCNSGPLSVQQHVVTIHDIAVLEHPEWFSKAYAALYRLLVPQLVQRAKCIITVSQHTKDRLIRLLGAADKKIKVVPNGIADHFSPQPASESLRVRQLLEIPDGPYLLSVCSLEPRKNLSRLLAAWRSLGKRVGDANLIIAGAKGKSSVFGLCESGHVPDRVFFTGYVREEDLAALYSGSLALLYPSLYEGFGLPVLEAAACGTQVITSNVTATAEIAGPSAMLVDPRSESAIAAAMEGILNNAPSPRLRQLGMEHARQYTWDRTAWLTQSVLLSCC